MGDRICELFNIEHPIIQGGMVWCSGWRLASAVSNAGGLGLIGAGSMHPETLREHIRKCRQSTGWEPVHIDDRKSIRAISCNPFGVNVPLMYPQLDEIMQIIVEEQVPIVFTSAGSPKKWTAWLHDHGVKVAHVVSNTDFARKCEEAGVDAIVAEGFEAGGHNGREETTTLCLVPLVRQVTTLPLLAAGGISSSASYHAAFAMGADGVQIGTRFALCAESSAHPDFKARCREIGEGQTKLLLKKISPTRLVENEFSKAVIAAEGSGASVDQLKMLLGNGRSKKGIFEGDLTNGALEIGQTAGTIKHEETVQEIFADLLQC